MAFKKNEIQRFRKREQSRGRVPSVPDDDAQSELVTRDKMIRLLLEIENEEEFTREFRRTMSALGLQIGPKQLNAALRFWRGRHPR